MVNPSIPAYGPQGAQLTVGSVAHFGYATALQNIQAGTRIASPPPYQAYDIHWNAIGNTFISTYPGLKATGCACKDRLGYLRDPAASFDYAACLPVYPGSAGGSNPVPVPPVDPPVPPVTPPSTTLKFSTAFDGTDPSKLKTGTKVNASAFVQVSPPWTASLAKVSGGTATTNGLSTFPLAVLGATRVVLKGCTFTSASDWSYLNSAVRVMADGRILWSATGAVLGTMPKVKADVVIQFSSAVDLSTVIGMPGNSAPVFSVEAMEVW